MNTFYLIRHGQKNKNIGNPGLTDLGKKQAKLTGQYLSSFKIDKIFNSPSKRTLETATIIAKEIGIDTEVDMLLRERVNWGDDPNQSLDDFLNMWVQSSNNRSWQPPVGDSSIDAGNRMLSFIKNIIILRIHRQ